MKDLCQILQGEHSVAARAEASSGQTYCLSKLTSDDNIEAYIYAFEMTAATARWPPTQQVIILALYLTGLAQVVLKTIPAQEVSDYKRVKAAILDLYEVREETQWQIFATNQGTGPRPW